MNILLTTFQGDVAGSTNSMSYLADGLAKRGHRVWMLCRKESLIFQILKDSDVQCHHFEFPSKFSLKSARALRDFCRRYEIDIINSQSGKDRYTVIWAKLFYGLKTPHINTRRQRPKSDGGKIVNKFIARYCEKIVAVSESIKNNLISIGYPSEKLAVIHNGTPAEKYETLDQTEVQKLSVKLELDTSKPIIGSVSRLKNHGQLLRALQKIDIPLQVLLVGIQENEELKTITEELEIDHKVYFLGTVTNEDALHYLKLMDVCVQPSTMEGISQSILEAMYLEIPVIATNSSGNPELITDGETGLLFEDSDVESIAEMIQRLIKDPDLSRTITKNAKANAIQKFGMERVLDDYEKLFNQVRL